MGKPTGFIEFPRKSFVSRGISERISDFREIYLPRGQEELVQQGSRCMDCGIPYCHAMGCPLGNLIPDWNDAVYRGEWEEAFRLLSETNPLPEITGRVCPALCEASCTLSINESPVTIKMLEYAIAEEAFQSGFISDLPPRRETGKTVGIIGSGPAGLAAASFLRDAGHRVTVFERDAKPGGLLRYGIPDFKLDKQILDRRVEILERRGVLFETSVNAGEDLSGGYLQKKFDTLLLATGCRVPRNLPVQGRDFEGIYFAMDYLSSSNRFLGAEIGRDERINARNKRVLVLGGGDTGADCVGTAVRQGAVTVHQFEIMREPSEYEGGSNPEWPYWPNQKRTSSSHEEGCIREWGIETLRFSGAGVRVNTGYFRRVAWEFGKEGRLQYSPVPGTEFSLEIDLVLLAMGFVSAEENALIKSLGINLGKNGKIQTNFHKMTSVPGVFTAGDAAAGASLVVRAIKDGLEAAVSMDKYLKLNG